MPLQVLLSSLSRLQRARRRARYQVSLPTHSVTQQPLPRPPRLASHSRSSGARVFLMLPPLVIVAFLIATTSGVNASVLVSVTQPARSQRLRARDVIAAGTGHLVFSHGRLILLVCMRGRTLQNGFLVSFW